jgi:GNAT superfamily N-acetyltransferase
MRIREIGPGETHLAFSAMRELRPHLTDVRAFARHVDEKQRGEGYRLAGAFDDAPLAVAVAGFRVAHNLAWGRHVYVDDLSTLSPARRRGYAGALLDWLAEEGRRLGCGELHLDSGVGPQRSDAHRLYLNAGLTITSHHFSRALSDPA